MAARKSKPFIKPLRVDAAVMRQQLDQLATLCACFANRPLHQLFADPAAAPWRGDANVLDQGTRGALRTEARQDAELQAADHGAVTLLSDHKMQIRIAIDRIERCEIALRQRILEPLEMRSTSLSTWDVPAVADYATPHIKRDRRVQTTAWRNLAVFLPTLRLSDPPIRATPTDIATKQV